MSLFDNIFGKAGDSGGGSAKNSTWLTLRAIVGGYVAYLGYGLVRNGDPSGESSMPDWLRICLGVLFMAAGAAVIALAAYAYRKAYLKEQSEAAEADGEKDGGAGPADAESITGPEADEDAADSERCQAIAEIYRNYKDAAEKAKAAEKPADGLFGLGNDARKAPCHEIFYNAVSEKLDQYAREDIGTAEAKAITGYILRAPDEHRGDKLVFPMMFAAAGLAEKIVPFLRPADADKLAIEFSESFPKPERMPAQEKTLRALYDRAMQQ